jgi:LysM repeat protein
MTSKAGMIGLGAAAIAAAIAGIAVAVDNYNSKVLNDNLEEHFGKIKLSAKEAEEIASGILNQKYLTNVELALNEVKNADSLREAAQKALESNDVLEFKSRVGITLTPEEREDYTSNIKTFVDSKIEELQSRTFAAHIHVQTYIGGTKEGDTLAKNIEDWARADNLELTNLSNDLQTAVEKALTDGIIDVDEEQAISALQEKMNNITARWKESEAQAKWDWINQEYGNLNAADLESGSFTDLLEAMRGQRQSAKESVQADVEQWYSELNSMESSGRITAAQNKQYKEMTGWYVKGQEGSELTKSLQLGANTLNSAYAEKIQSNRQSLAENAQYSLESAQNMLASGDTFSASNALMYGFNELGNGKTLGFTTDATQNALSTMYESMKPDVTQMQGLIDDYREAGKAVPQSLMDSFNEAIEVGAAAGDTAATWQNYANQIWQNGSDELKASLTDPSNPMYETIRSQLPPELTEAIDRAAAETTTEDVTLEGLKASVDGDVDIDKDKWVSALNEKLGDLATTEEVTAEGATIKVEAGDCLWDIGNALGVDWQTIAEENGIESPYVIHPGDEIKISMDTLTAEVDGDAAQSAIDQAMSALTTEGAEFSVTAEGVQVDLSDVQVDSESAAAQIEAALGMESGTLAANGIEVETGATVTVPSELVQVDASGLQGATQEAVNQTDTEPVEKDTSANVNVTDTTTNAEDVQGKVEEDLQGAVGDASVEGSANVTFSDVTADTSGVLEQVTAELESAVSSVPANGHAEITLDQTNNSSEIYSLATGDVESAFSQTIPTDGHVDVTLDQTNNADAIYSECAGQVRSTFSRGFSASADVAVTLNWHITNPSASISTSSSGSSVSATIAGHANGGEVGLSGAELSWVGEEGLEYIIPTVPGRRQRGISLWMQAGKTLGMLGPDGEISAHANGGAVGAGSSIIPEDSIQLAQVPEKADNTVWSIMGQAVSNESSKDASEGDGTTFTINNAQQNDGGGKVEVNVNMNPVIKIEGSNMDEEKIFQVLQNRIREMADDLGDEIAERMGKIFNNMPAVQEA